jgi:hypothetical protein
VFVLSCLLPSVNSSSTLGTLEAAWVTNDD